MAPADDAARGVDENLQFGRRAVAHEGRQSVGDVRAIEQRMIQFLAVKANAPGRALEEIEQAFQALGLAIELREEGFKRLVLRQNYGDKIEREFGLTRQGLRQEA